MRDGHLLLCRDEAARLRHRVATILEYLDQEPLRHLVPQGLGHRLARKPLVDAEALRLRLRELDRRIGALREAREEGREPFLSDPRLRTAV